MKLATLSLQHIIRAARPGNALPPLLILLHGIGSNEQDLMGLAPYFDERFLIVSARGPITLIPDAYAWYHVDFLPDRMTINAEEEARSRQSLIRFIGEATQAYGADPKRVYLVGFSQGAIMSYSLMLTVPEKLAGVVAMSGRLLDQARLTDNLPAVLNGFPLIVTHGLFDNVIAIDYARQAKAYLETLPVRLTYKEYSMAHHVSEESLRDILDWLNSRLEEDQT